VGGRSATCRLKSADTANKGAPDSWARGAQSIKKREKAENFSGKQSRSAHCPEPTQSAQEVGRDGPIEIVTGAAERPVLARMPGSWTRPLVIVCRIHSRTDAGYQPGWSWD